MTQVLGEIIRFCSLPQFSTENTCTSLHTQQTLLTLRSGNFFFHTYIFCVQFNFLAEKQGLQIPNLISVPQSTFADSALIHHLATDWCRNGRRLDNCRLIKGEVRTEIKWHLDGPQCLWRDKLYYKKAITREESGCF